MQIEPLLRPKTRPIHNHEDIPQMRCHDRRPSLHPLATNLRLAKALKHLRRIQHKPQPNQDKPLPIPQKRHRTSRHKHLPPKSRRTPRFLQHLPHPRRTPWNRLRIRPLRKHVDVARFRWRLNKPCTWSLIQRCPPHLQNPHSDGRKHPKTRPNLPRRQTLLPIRRPPLRLQTYL